MFSTCDGKSPHIFGPIKNTWPFFNEVAYLRYDISLEKRISRGKQFFYHKGEGSTFFQDIGSGMPEYVALHLRTQLFSGLPLWDPHVSQS
jgi:hypothetical protein